MRDAEVEDQTPAAKWPTPTGVTPSACVFSSTYYKAVREGGGGGMEDMCYERLRAEAGVN
jgi:hypothetical protein